MPKFSAKSLSKLKTCHPLLQEICHELIKTYDFSVNCGHRGKAEQDKAVRDGASKAKWPTSRHNKTPSLAVDIYPYPFPGWGKGSMPAWEKQRKLFLACAKKLKIEVQTISWDWPHFQLPRNTK